MEGQISRRDLIKSGTTQVLLAAVGTGGLVSMLANRQAVAAGTVLAVVGVTSEVGDRNPKSEGAAHRHTFSAGFIFKSLNENNGDILGDLIGQTNLVLQTGPDDEEFHVHPIRLFNVLIGQTKDTLVRDMHAHSLHID